jgi:hypothetical protein
MKISDYGVKEVWNLKTTLLALFGIRTVKAISFHHTFKIAVVGVPPWRSLKTSDFYNKNCYELQ